MFENIRYEVEDGIAWITIDRPEVRNALSIDTLREILTALSQASDDLAVRVVIFTGAGDKAFVAGADIRMLTGHESLFDVMRMGFTEIFDTIEKFDKPTIAAVNGVALGGGCELCLCCDLRVAVDTARFALPEVNLGVMPAAGATQRLRHFVGLGRAKEMIYTGAAIDAVTAERFGLVNRVVGREKLRAAVLELANEIASKAPLAVQMAKRTIHIGIQGGQQAGMQFEKHAQAILFSTGDKAEGVGAFLEKRKPQWQGT